MWRACQGADWSLQTSDSLIADEAQESGRDAGDLQLVRANERLQFSDRAGDHEAGRLGVAHEHGLADLGHLEAVRAGSRVLVRMPVAAVEVALAHAGLDAVAGDKANGTRDVLAHGCIPFLP